MPTKDELAWAAGLFEGEGCFTGHFHRGRVVIATIQMMDEDVIRRFSEIMEIGKFRGAIVPKRTDRVTQYRWSTSTFEHFQQTVCYLWPWLGERRKAKATSLLQRYLAWQPKPKSEYKKRAPAILPRPVALGPKARPEGVEWARTTPKASRNDEVRSLFRAGTDQNTLAERYGVSQARISAIVNFNGKGY